MPRPSADFWCEALKSSSAGRGRFIVLAVAIILLATAGLAPRLISVQGKPAPEPPRRIVVLVYHHLAPAEAIINPHNTVSPERFDEQLGWFKAHGYETVTPADLYAYLSGMTPKPGGGSARAGGRALPSKPLVITFDDGYESNFVYAYPILKKYGFQASIDLVAKWVRDDPSGRFDPAVLTYLSWDEVREMAADRTVNFQSHTYNLHRAATDGTPDTLSLPPVFVLGDLISARSLIETKTGQPVLALAYPYGRYSPELIRLSTEAGYKLGLTIDDGFAYPGNNPMTVRRCIISMDDTPERLAKRFGK